MTTIKNGAVDPSFDTLVDTIYPLVVPQMGYDIVEHDAEVEIDMRAHYARTGFVPVFEAYDDEARLCERLTTYYKLMAWINYRAMQSAFGQQSTFELLSADVLRFNKWGPEVAQWLTIIDGIVNVQKEYDAKFKHLPVDISKFIRSVIKNGRTAVLKSDRY